MTTKFAPTRIAFIVITILGLILTLIPVKALAVESIFQGSFQKNDSLTAARVGKDVVITWNRDITNDVSYSVFVGEFIIRAGGRALPKIPVGSNVGTFTDSTRSNAIYSLIYQSNKVKQYNASGKIFFEHKVAIDNRNQAVILMKKTKDNFTYDYRIIVDRDGSVGAGFLKFGCRVSAWGLPLAKGVLSVSNLSLTMISYLPGGQAAGLAGTALDKFELVSDTSLVRGAEVVRGTATYVIKADQIDLWAKVKPRDALRLGLGGINANGTVRSIKRISKTDKFNLVVDIAVSADEINKLYSTISTARSQYVETNALCAMLN
jgi:hypothetical protein